MEKEFLTVKEFAELAGVSVQSIYKKLTKPNNPIQRYLKEVDGVKYISRTAYRVLYNPTHPASDPCTVEESNPAASEQPEQQTRSSNDRLLDILEQQLEEQRRQLQEKDKQLAAQAEQIGSLLARLEESSKIIDQQQQLTAMNVQALLGAGKGDEETIGSEEQQPTAEEQQKPEEKRSFWNIFKKK